MNRPRPNSKEQILRASVTVMARKGYHGTRISDIAEQAGVAYGLVYHYFSSKEFILRTLIDSVEERFRLKVEKIGHEPITLTEKLGRISDYMLDTYLASPDMIHLLVQEVVRSNHLNGPGQLASVRRLLRQIEKIMQSGIKSGELESDCDAKLQAIAFFGCVQLLLTGLVQGFYGDRKQASTSMREVKKKMRTILSSGSFGKSIETN